MNVKLTKVFDREKYWFKVSFDYKENVCNVRSMGTNNNVTGRVNSDLTYILLEQAIELKGRGTKEGSWLNGKVGFINKIKLPKEVSYCLKNDFDWAKDIPFTGKKSKNPTIVKIAEQEVDTEWLEVVDIKGVMYLRKDKVLNFATDFVKKLFKDNKISIVPGEEEYFKKLLEEKV